VEEVLPPHPLRFIPAKGRSPFLPLPSVAAWFVDFRAMCVQWASSSVVMTNSSLVYFRIFDEVMGCFCDSPPQSPTFPEAGHASLYDEDKVWSFLLWRLLSAWKQKACRMPQ